MTDSDDVTAARPGPVDPPATGPSELPGAPGGAGVAGDERIGNSDREAAIAALKTHHGEGRIDAQEYEERALQARQARTWAQLHHLFVDLPDPRPKPGGGMTVAGPMTPARPAPAVGGQVTPGTEGFEGAIPAHERHGLIPEPYAWMIMALTPIAAVIVFFLTGDWEWFLAIPIAGILVYGPDGDRDRHRDRHRNRRRDRYNR